MANVKGAVTVYESSDGGSGNPAKMLWQAFIGDQPVSTENAGIAETLRLAVGTESEAEVTFDPERGNTISQVRLDWRRSDPPGAADSAGAESAYTAPARRAPAAVPHEAEFSLFPDNTVLGPRFTYSGYEFHDLGTPPSFVNQSGGVKGLQFGRTGLRVRLPVERSVVTVRAAAFATAFVVSAKDAAGNVLYPVTIPGDNQPHDVQLTHPGIASLDFVGGGNEGIVLSIAIDVC